MLTADHLPPPGRSPRILCVDDDPVSRDLLTAILTRAGWAVQCVGDGRRVIERFEADAGAFDLLVTDHAMPGLDGVGLVERLRDRGFAGEVIVISAGMPAEDMLRYRGLGARFILLKPIAAPRLREVVNAALGTRPQPTPAAAS